MEESQFPRSRGRKRTITVKQLLQVISVIVILLAAVFGYFYWKSKQPVDLNTIFSMNEPPKYLFSIYGNEKKPLKSPMAAYVSRKGLIYVSSTNNHEIQVFKPNGIYLYSFGKPGSNPGELLYPYGITENEKGNLLIAETGNKRIQEFTPEGKFVKLVANPGGSINVQKPGPLYTSNGKLYIADLVKHEVIVVDGKGKTERSVGGITYPHGVAVDDMGHIFISDSGSYRITMFDKKGRERKSISAWQPKNGFSLLRGLALDQVNRIYVADSITSVIRVFDPDGNYLFSFGAKGFDKGEFLYPTGIFIDSSNRIYIADWANNRIEVWGF